VRWVCVAELAEERAAVVDEAVAEKAEAVAEAAATEESAPVEEAAPETSDDLGEFFLFFYGPKHTHTPDNQLRMTKAKIGRTFT